MQYGKEKGRVLRKIFLTLIKSTIALIYFHLKAQSLSMNGLRKTQRIK